MSKSRKAGGKKSSSASAVPSLAIYPVMRAEETFEDTADILFQLVKSAARENPGVRRQLFLDIEGHRNAAGGFDHDALELQKNFIMGYLGRWLSEVSAPLASYVREGGQLEDVPDSLMVTPGGSPEARGATLLAQAKTTGTPVFDAETGEWVHSDGTRRGRD